VGSVDLHMHSTASDGDCAPEEVVRRAAAAGLTTIGLTDHDSLAGLPAAEQEGRAVGVDVVTGCEFSVAAPWGEMHLLAYFLPADDERLNAFLLDQRLKRRRRAERIVERLNKAGAVITVEQVLQASSGEAIGRPHVARALVDGGLVPDVDTAFRRYLGWRRPAFVPKELPPVADVTALVREVGGVTSAAHLRDRATRGILRQLRGAGLDGVEVMHPAHDEATVQRVERLAAELDLLPTGGTDWHGDCATPPERAALGSITIPEEWLERLRTLHLQRTELPEAT
jgi:predicted metal-dependent phosphoesterase TrpH